MNATEYQKEVMKTAINLENPHEMLAFGAIGLAGEVSEVVEPIKKYLFHGGKLDNKVMASELGDVLWYVTYLATCLGLDLGAIQTANLGKTQGRHREGYYHGTI